MWLIDGNKLKEKAVPLLFPTEMESCGHIPAPVQAVTVSEIEDMMCRDSVEVVHGRWVICSDGYYPYCSECKEEPYRKSNADLPKFCPNCGARMDGE